MQRQRMRRRLSLIRPVGLHLSAFEWPSQAVQKITDNGFFRPDLANYTPPSDCPRLGLSRHLGDAILRTRQFAPRIPKKLKWIRAAAGGGFARRRKRKRQDGVERKGEANALHSDG